MRGKRYSVDATQAVASPDDSVLGITSTSAIRPTIYDILIGSEATPADNALVWKLQRHTANGTSTPVTPLALDPGDPAATTTGQGNHTGEPTFTASAILFHLALNQRASHRWIADPDGGLVCPATANNGITAYPVHASFTGLTNCCFHFQE